MIKKSYLVRMLANLVMAMLILSPQIALASAKNAPAAPGAAQQGAGLEGAQDSGAAAGGEYSPVSREYHLKAAFLRYVAKFVEWPAESLSAGVINICVLGLVPSYEALSSINGKEVNDRTIVISKIGEVNEAKGKCQILFITKTEEDNVKKIISAVQGLPILSFGDMEHFAEAGGDMNFYVLNNRLAIMINPPQVEKARLKISERMLKVVTVVPPVDQSAKPAT